MDPLVLVGNNWKLENYRKMYNEMGNLTCIKLSGYELDPEIKPPEHGPYEIICDEETEKEIEVCLRKICGKKKVLTTITTRDKTKANLIDCSECECAFLSGNSFNNISKFNIDLTGVAHGDSLVYNTVTNKLTQTQIPFIPHGDISKPNFIIALTGQSNSQGWNSFYDSTNIFDQPHERIFGFNSTTQTWDVADLNTESTGSFWHKPAGYQSLAFHFAKRLVEAYPDIRPGIINLGVAGQVIARWAKFHENNIWYQENTDRAASIGQGDIYDLHVHKITQALEQLDDQHKKINVICWHQGENDGGVTDPLYYTSALSHVINQYRSLNYCNSKTPFIVGETTGADEGTDHGWEARNIQLRNLNIDADPYTKCIKSADLETSHGQYNNCDNIHFSANSQRKICTRYFNAFRDIFS